MRVATVISLLLFACAACGLVQLRHERRDDFRRSWVNRRRSFQQRRLLASRSIVPSILSPDIVLRGNPMNPYYYSPAGAEKTLNKLLHGTRRHVILAEFFGFYRVYRVRLDGKSVIVKEINLSHVTNWNKRQVQEEVRGADSVGKLADAFFDGETYFILTEDMGLSWDTVEHGVGDAAQRIRDEADARYKENAHMKRVLPHGVSLDNRDYAWTHEGHWRAEPVGKWRFWKSTKQTPEVRKDIHYSGIKEWIDGLPIFATLDSRDTREGVHR